MANENAKIDENYRKSLLGVTDDVAAEIRRLLVDPVTGRLKVSAVISGGMLSSLNGLEEATQTFTIGTTGTDFGIVSAEGVHTFNIPTASATNRGLLNSADWSTFNGKQDALGFTPQEALGFTPENSANKGQNNGYASLDSGGKVPTSQLPALALTDVSVVASQAAQLALTAQEGDVAIRSDLNKSYIHNGGVAGTMADWSEMLTPTDTVLSVNGATGAVTLNQDNIGDGTTYKQYSATEKTKLAGIETGADVTDAGNVEDAISGSGETTTPADANLFSLIVGGVLTKLSWANLKATLKTYFDTLYTAITTKCTGAEITTGTDDAKFATPKALADAGVNTRLKSISKTLTRDMSTASGSVAYTGVGFQPSAVEFKAVKNASVNFFWGSAGSDRVISGIVYDAGAYYGNQSSFKIVDSGANNQTCAIASYDSDGITLSWSKNGTPTGTIYIAMLFLK